MSFSTTAPARFLGLILLVVTASAPPLLRAQATSVVLVRHAEKVDDSKDPDLSPVGVARADSLRAALAAFPIQGIFVSEYRRTAQTAAPTAEAMRLTPTIVPLNGEKAAQARATAAAIGRMAKASAALVVGHSNTLGLIIAALGGPEVAELCDGEYATLFLLELPDGRSPRLLRVTYGTPDPPEATACHQGPGPA